MVKRLKSSMKKKGWEEGELDHLEETLNAVKIRDHKTRQSLSDIFFWMLLLILFILNFIGILIISPFLLILEGFWLYAVSGAFALLLGIIASNIISHFKGVDFNHQMSVGISFVVMLGIDVYVFPKYMDFLGSLMRLSSSFGYLQFAIFFVVILLLPYVIFHHILPLVSRR